MFSKKMISKKEFCDYARAGYNVIPVGSEIIGDTHTPVSLLQKFSDRKDLFLLESVIGGENWGRYSFLGVSANSRVRVNAKNIEVESKSTTKTEPHHGDPLAALNRLIESYREVTPKNFPRFSGGLVGCVNYEMISFIENIDYKCADEEIVSSFIIPDQLIIFDNIKHTITAVSMVYIEDSNDSEALYKEAEAVVANLISKIETTKEVSKPTSSSTTEYKLKSNCRHQEFIESVEKVKKQIYEGNVIQTVISQKFSGEFSEDPVLLYRALRYINPSPYLYFFKLDSRVIIGASPETMVRLENNKAYLRPIAGTRKRGATAEEDAILAADLLADKKECAEHLMLVDLSRNDLSRIAKTGSVEVTKLMTIENYSHVMHIVSEVVAEVDKEFNCIDLFRATFPAGTLTGAPKVSAMHLISKLEKDSRGCYGGAVGYIGFNGNMDMAITIRTAVISDNTLTVQAGAGVVADSVAESEYQETINKASAILKAIELINGGN